MPRTNSNNIIRTSSVIILFLALVIFGYATIAAQYETKRTAAMEDLRIIKLSIEAFKLKNNELPLNIISLESEGIMKRTPIDPWGNNYRLALESTQEAAYYAVFSAGDNGNFGIISFEDGVLTSTDPGDIGKTNAILPRGNSNWQ